MYPFPIHQYLLSGFFNALTIESKSKRNQFNKSVGGPVLLVEIISVRYRPLEPDLVETSVGNIQSNFYYNEEIHVPWASCPGYFFERRFHIQTVNECC